MNRYLARPKHPLWDVLKALTGRTPPAYVKKLYSSRPLGDRVNELQDWCSQHCKPSWGTGIGLLEAAEKMVEEAVMNGNIPPEPEPEVIAAPGPRGLVSIEIAHDLSSGIARYTDGASELVRVERKP